MQAAHASVLHCSTSVLHSTSTTALLDNAVEAGLQAAMYSITAHAAQVPGSHV